MGLIDRDDGWRMPDWLWQKIEPLLPPPPPHPLGTHRARIPNRRVMDAILLVLRTGMQWNALRVTGICNSSTAHRRFQEWERAGVFHEIWREGLLDYDETVGIDWAFLAADGAMTKAPLGGEQDRAQPHRSRQKGAKRSVLTEARPACPSGSSHDGANRNDHKLLQGHPRLDPHRAAEADRGGASGSLLGQGLRQHLKPRAAWGLRLYGAHPQHAARRSKRSSQIPTGERDGG